VLFEAAGQTGRLLIVVHHFAVDGLSWRILLEDLTAAYGQLQRGESIVLPPRTLSFRGWAHRLQAWADSPADAEIVGAEPGARIVGRPRLAHAGVRD